MSRTLRHVVPALALAIIPITAAAATADEANALIAVDKHMQRAFVDRDVAVLDQIFTDDYVLVVSSGEERSKAQILKEVASGDTHWEVNETSEWKVRVHGNLAIVVATLHQKGTSHGKPFDSHVKFSDTYLRDHGAWRNVHAHASRAVDVPKDS